MNLGALIDLGVDPAHLKKELEKLNIQGFHLEIKKDIRKGITGTKATVVIENQENEHHRHLHHIEDLIRNSTLSESIRERSLRIFDLIAEAESKIHNISKQHVHFHEVGALDSIADIVGAAICLDFLEVDEVRSSAVQLGGGWVKSAHGMIPVPAPATSEILKQIPVRAGLVEHEATTPTGAAILAATVDRFTADLDFKIIRTGYGIGNRDSEIPNVLRVYLAEAEETGMPDYDIEDANVIECNIDDMNPEWFELISSNLFKAGAADVFIIPMIMKKSRPANMLSVLCNNDSLASVKEIIFTQTTSIGFREYKVRKNMLRREVVTVETAYGPVRVKQSFYKGKLVNSKPEFEDCGKLAMKHKLSLQEIQIAVFKKL
jgi:uncharacterized protein (TIGR00299 family) protein